MKYFVVFGHSAFNFSIIFVAKNQGVCNTVSILALEFLYYSLTRRSFRTSRGAAADHLADSKNLESRLLRKQDSDSVIQKFCLNRNLIFLLADLIESTSTYIGLIYIISKLCTYTGKSKFFHHYSSTCLQIYYSTRFQKKSEGSHYTPL